MIIDFEKLGFQTHEHFKGGEKEYRSATFDDGQNKIMSGCLIPGASIGLHTHIGNSEVIYITEGEGYVFYDDVKERVSSGVCHYCPEGHTHSLVNDSTDRDLKFIAIVPQR